MALAVCTTSMPMSRAAASTAAIGFNRPRQLRDVVAQRFAEAAGLHEITLHVDDDERRARQFNSIDSGSAATTPLKDCFEFAMTSTPHARELSKQN